MNHIKKITFILFAFCVTFSYAQIETKEVVVDSIKSKIESKEILVDSIKTKIESKEKMIDTTKIKVEHKDGAIETNKDKIETVEAVVDTTKTIEPLKKVFVDPTKDKIELKNIVIDFSTDAPIESASVYVKNTTIGTVTNADGKFVIQVPNENIKDTLVISSIGYSTFKVPIEYYDAELPIYLDEEVASLDEVLLVGTIRPKTGNEIVLKALEEMPYTMPDSSYLQKGFLRHKERNKIEFKWLIESAISVYDPGYVSSSKGNIKINVDQVRKSYDLRDVDSLFSFSSYVNQNSKKKYPKIRRSQVETASLVKAIKWNDNRINGLQNVFHGKLNVFRNTKGKKALFGDDILDKHQFELDTVLVDNERKLYKIRIKKGNDFVGLDTKGVFNEGYEARGWIYIYWDNYAFKKIEYELVASSAAQKTRSKSLFDTQINHKLVITYKEYKERMYPNYIYYETPKLVNVGRPKKRLTLEETLSESDKRYYYTIQEILFSEIILDKEEIDKARKTKWDMDIFSPKTYNKEFWKNYNILLESEEEQELIQDLSRKATLFKG